MGFTDPFIGMFPPRELSRDETVQALRLDAMAELDAIALYQSHLNAIRDPKVRQVLEHIRDEEKQHLAEFLAAIERLDPFQAQALRSRQPVMPTPSSLDTKLEALEAEYRR